MSNRWTSVSSGGCSGVAVGGTVPDEGGSDGGIEGGLWVDEAVTPGVMVWVGESGKVTSGAGVSETVEGAEGSGSRLGAGSRPDAAAGVAIGLADPDVAGVANGLMEPDGEGVAGVEAGVAGTSTIIESIGRGHHQRGLLATYRLEAVP